jgi:hypothetical protein
MTIDAKQAMSDMSDIEDIVTRVRRSRFYQLGSLTMIMWGVLVAIGYLSAHQWPRTAGQSWTVIYILGAIGSFAISFWNVKTTGVRTFDTRMLAALVLFILFGVFCCKLGQFAPRQLSAFWPIYFMTIYTIMGLWIGLAFVVIGLSVTALTLIGYALVGESFDLWMAAVNGGGLILGGLWMRRS